MTALILIAFCLGTFTGAGALLFVYRLVERHEAQVRRGKSAVQVARK